MAMRYLPDVVTLRLDVEQCNGCRMCTLVCPHGVFLVSNGKARVVDRDGCMECGACAMNCREGAIYVDSGVGCAYALLKSKLDKLRGGTSEDVSCC